MNGELAPASLGRIKHRRVHRRVHPGQRNTYNTSQERIARRLILTREGVPIHLNNGTKDLDGLRGDLHSYMCP